MTGLADVAYRVGTQRGFRAETRQNKVDNQQDEDRSLRLARDAKTDTFVDESRTHTQEQWKQQDAATANATEAGKLKLDETRKRIEDEGALDFLYEIDAGGDPAQAVARHNARGRSKMVDGSVQVHEGPDGNKVVSYDMDSEGDGSVKHFEYDVGKTIGALEQITGKNAKDRFLNVPDGGNVFDRRKGAFVAENPKDPTGRAATGAPVKVGPKDRLWDPATKKFITQPLSGGGGAASAGITKFNPQTYYNDVSNQLGKYLGGKYDPTSQQWDFGGATAKVQVLNRIAQGEAQRLVGAQGAISAPMIATVVAQAADHVVVTDPNTKEVTYEGPFDPDKIRAAVKANIEQHPSAETNEEGKIFGLGKVKPDVLKHLQDTAVQNAVIEMGVRARIALDGAYQRNGDPNAPAGTFEGEPGGPAPTDEAQVSQDIAGEQGVDENGDFIDPTTTAADYQPAVDPVTRQPAGPAELATPPSLRRPGDAGALPPDAPPREKLRALKPGQGLRKGNVIWYIDAKGQLQKKAASGD